jgi:hypothetical protein
VIGSALRVGQLAVLGIVLVACSSGLGNTESLWCAQHLAAVDDSAAELEVQVSDRTYQEPSWLPDYLTSALNFSNALIAANTAFTAACDVAADERGVGETRISWCTTDGIAEVWDASVTLGLMVDLQGTTYAYKSQPLTQRRSDADFVRSCRAAYAARTS